MASANPDAKRIQRAVRAESYGAVPSELRADLQIFARGARLGRAARVGIPLVAVGLLLVVVPPHWTGLVVAGIGAFQGARRLRQTETLLGLHGPCPKCRSHVELPLPRRFTAGATVRCPSCGEFLQLYDDVAAAAG